MNVKELLEKITIKRCIAKIQFSHVMCICAGALIPIYGDVLFLHGFDSSTVSAIMDTVVALSVIFAAWSVRNWTKEKINNKGFEHAERILSNINSSYVNLSTIMFCMDEFYKNYITYVVLSDHDFDRMKTEARRLTEESNKLNIQLSEIFADLYSLKSWSMVCNQNEKYKEYLNGAEEVRNKCHLLLSVENPRRNTAMRRQWNKTFRNIEDNFGEIKDTYLDLEIRFEKAFMSKRKSKN